MAGLQLTGLASGFDWKSLVDQLMEIERVPITRLGTEQTKNTQAKSALVDVGTRLSSLQTAANALKAEGLFTGRKVSLSASGWSAAAAAGAAAGSYQINVTQLATATRRAGAADIAQGLTTTSDVSGLTLATLPTGMAVTAGEFSVNGQRIRVALSDSLQDVFDAIATATDGAVSATYDESTDRVSLNGTSEISLGASNDTSNFLRVLKLANNGTDTVASSGALGTMKGNSTLATSGLRTAVTAVDGTGAGEFKINGATISYNLNTESLNTVLKRINQSGAGVTATYDSLNDRVNLTNQTTGDVSMAIEEDAGGLLGALGLTGGTVVRGLNTEFTINGGGTLSSVGSTLDEATHGIAGLNLTVGITGTQTVAIEPDTAEMRTKIDGFITAYNTLQSFIDERTKITASNGSVAAAVLANNREVQSWASEMRALAFSVVEGTGLRLEGFGIDFKSGTSQLEVKDVVKLEAALRDRPGEMEDFFQQSSTGFAAKFDSRLTTIIAQNGEQQARLTKSNSSIDDQIAGLERRLEQQRALLESSFIRMEEAQARIQQQSSTLQNAFPSTSTQ